MKTLVAATAAAAAVLAVASATGSAAAESSPSHHHLHTHEPTLPTPRYCSHKEQMKDIEIEGLSRAQKEELKPTLVSVQVGWSNRSHSLCPDDGSSEYSSTYCLHPDLRI